MAEYYAVLSKAITGLTGASSETRRAVYDKARNALISQLRAIDPPLPTSEISRQRLELEEAIRRVEREIQAGILPVPPRPQQVISAPSAPPPRQAAAPGADAARRTPHDMFRQAILDAEGRGWHGQPDAGSAARPPGTEGPPVVRPAAREAQQDRDDEFAALPPHPDDQVPPIAPDAASHAFNGRVPGDPRLGPNYGYGARGDRPPPPPERSRELRLGPAPIDPEIDEVPPPPPPPVRRWGRRDRGADAYATPQRRRSRVPLLILLFLVLTGGVAFAAWTQLPTIKAIVAAFDAPGARAPADAAIAVPDATASSKNGDRLLAPGPGDKPVRVVGDPPPGGAPAATGSVPRSGTATTALVPPSSATPVRPPAGAAPGQQAAVTPPATSTSPPAQVAPVAGTQKAVLYEEPSDAALAATSTLAISGNVTWSFVANGANGPEIVGSVAIPDRKLKIRLVIRRNLDTSLPASHMVEATVETAADFPGKSVQAMPTMVLKSTEDAKGDVLVGASITVAPGFYWIALSSAQRDQSSNVGLLRDRGWIDIRLVYQTGQRAILTLEKGPSGETAFARALAAWRTG